MFFLAFVPQFIAADAPNKALAFIVPGCVFNLTSMLWCNVLAVASALASRRIWVSRLVAAWINRATGTLFLPFGIKLAFSEHVS